LKSLWEKCDKFEVLIQFTDIPIEPPREGDQWLMRMFVSAGYSANDLLRLNRVRLHQQVLFLSDILGASGKTLDGRYVKKRRPGETWSELKFPHEQPPRKDFTFWAQALQQLVPAGGIMDRLGRFHHQGYKRWPWRYDGINSRLLHLHDERMDIYVRPNARATRASSRWELQAANQPREASGKICTVRDAGRGRQAIVSTSEPPPPKEMPQTILDVLEDWGSTWMWRSLRLIGEDHWLEEAIAAGTCVAVTDGSYIREYFPDLCSAAFILECTEGRGRIIGEFPEQSSVVGAYRGELMGPMAIHLLVLAANKVNPTLAGSLKIYSDCLGALKKVSDLPSNRIPSRCRHSDILKNIMVNCSELSFSLTYLHVRAHQDDTTVYHLLSRPSQLNCIADLRAKGAIWGLEGCELPPQEVFPLEPVAVFVGKEKMTSDTAESLRFWAHHKLAEATFFSLGILSPHGFQEVAWKQVYATLHKVPRLFQLWACKQVMDVAGTNVNQAHYTEGHDPHCPSCTTALETCRHVLHCGEAGRVDALHRSIGWLDDWLKKVGTEPALRRCLVTYAKGRGSRSLGEITDRWGGGFEEMAVSQDAIGWRRFMEGMISKEILPLQQDYVELGECSLSLEAWVQGLVVKLLEVTHGQWLYRNLHVHDAVAGAMATARKEEIQGFIEDQLELGEEGLDPQDHYLLEINLDDMETSSGEDQHYWLLQIEAARRDHQLRESNLNNSNSGNHQG
jgi:hypothetical protein